MQNFLPEKELSQVLLFGIPISSIFLTTTGVSDPVNATKLFCATLLAFGCLSMMISKGAKIFFRENRLLIIAVVIFNITMLNALVNSSSPVVQNIYGAYGRNTGLLAYFSMSIIFVAVISLQTRDCSKKILGALFLTGLANAIYCAWVLIFGDFIKWENQYKNILGFFGNPDFVSAFLGIFIVSFLAILVKQPIRNARTLFGFAICVLSFYEIVKSHAIQGLVVTLGGLAVVCFFLIRERFVSKFIHLGYLAFSAFLGVLSIVGALGHGPLSFIYKRSVSLRGSYWRAGIDMGLQNPFHGVGLDSYGDWYRRSRPPVALVDLPGVNVTSNAAHNVIIDFFASGGWPLLVSYLVLIILTALSIFKVMRRGSSYDPIFVSLTSGWICYEAQSIISINQIGLMIWGWALGGAIIGYEKITIIGHQTSKSIEKKGRSKQANFQVFSPYLKGFVGMIVGIIVALPVINGDVSWRSALESSQLVNIEKALDSSYFQPSDSFKYAQAVDLFAKNNLMEVAHKYSLESVKFNKDYSVAWRQLYFLSNASGQEKAIALSNLKRLDPLNSNIVATE
jgi:O-antigen ligase